MSHKEKMINLEESSPFLDSELLDNEISPNEAEVNLEAESSPFFAYENTQPDSSEYSRSNEAHELEEELVEENFEIDDLTLEEDYLEDEMDLEQRECELEEDFEEETEEDFWEEDLELEHDSLEEEYEEEDFESEMEEDIFDEDIEAGHRSHGHDFENYLEDTDEEYEEELEESIFYEEEETTGNDPNFEGFLEEESSEMTWRMRPPIRYQGKKVICWAAAVSSWSMVTKGAKKFKTTNSVIDHFRRKRVVSASGALQSVRGLKAIKREFGLNVKKLTGAGSMSYINIGDMLKDSHLLVVFRRPGARFFHMVVVFGVDRFNVCYMDPAINPKLSVLDKVKQNRICRKIYLFGDGATDFWIFWKGKGTKEIEETEEMEFHDDLDMMDHESDYGAEATREKVRWYQTILNIAAGYKTVPVNGNHNDPATKKAMRDFQKKHHLKTSGYLQVDSNHALTQVALEWIYFSKIENKIGRKAAALVQGIKKFQRYFGLEVDGKIGKNTRNIFVQVLNAKLPSPLSVSHPQLGKGKILSREIPEDGLDTELPFLFENQEPGILNQDNRKAESRTSIAPNKWICRLKITYEIKRMLSHGETGKKIEFGGTGILISNNHILTAAHVLKSKLKVTETKADTNGKIIEQKIVSADQRALKILAFPGFNGMSIRLKKRRPFGKVKIKLPARISPFWEKPEPKDQGVLYNAEPPFSEFGHRFDFALLELEKPLNIGFWGSTNDFQIREIEPRHLKGGSNILAAGYPETTPEVALKKEKRSGVLWRGKGKLADAVNSHPNLVNDVNKEAPNIFFHTTDVTEGQSGGPCWKIDNKGTKLLLGINKHFFAGPNNKGENVTVINMGLALTKDVLQQIQNWAPDTFVLDGGRLRVRG